MTTTETGVIRTQLFIDGEFSESAAGETFGTYSPVTGDVLAQVAAGGPSDVDRAVQAAHRALDGSWGRLSLQDRASALRRVAATIYAHADELAALECADVGKPITECVAQVRAAATWFDFFADIAQHTRSSVIPTLPDHFTYTLRQPVGTVGLITPWNYPMVIYGIKMAAALAMGNAVVLKPAEQTPLSALALAAVCQEAGLPSGALAVVPGTGGVTGQAVVAHPGIPMISFTGSTDVGRRIAARCGSLLKKVTLELGGKSPNIVFGDADLQAAASTALFTFAVNQGQLCTAGSRLLVEDEVHDEFVNELVRQAEDLTIGDPFDAATQLGAVISAEQLARIERYVESGIDEGAHVLTGGRRASVGNLRGHFYTPTVFTDVPPAARIAQEEIFGPVLSVLPFRDEQEAVTLANDVLYGLAAGVWTTNLNRAHRMVSSIDAGLLYVNTMNVLTPNAPYSGWKQSGLGVEGGQEQAESFSRVKTVWMNTGSEVPRL